MLEGIDREGISILASWVGRPMSRNSVLKELREMKLEANRTRFQKWCFVGIECFVGSSMERKKGRAECHQHIIIIIKQIFQYTN